MKKRVVITGMGIITPVGTGVEKNWQALIDGKSGISSITSFDASAFPTQIAAQIKDFKPEEYIKDRKILRMLYRGDDYGLVAAKMAIDNANFEHKGIDMTKGGIYIGSGKEIGSPERMFEAVHASTNKDGYVDYHKFGIEAMKKVYPLFLVEDLPNACLYYISKIYKLQGVNSNIVTSGTASSQAIGNAFRAILHGDSNFIIAGGFDSHINPIDISYVSSLGLLSTNNDEPKEAFRPFDRTRDGFVIGEGAGMIVLEELNHALKRGAKIHAELIGYAATTDASGILKNEHNDGSIAIAITKALEDAQLSPQHLDYINAHGNATILNDKLETSAIKKAFGDRSCHIPISSIKPVTGHLIAASGAVELIATILAIKNNKVPPTINYKYPDPLCDLDYVPNQAREVNIDVALSINRDISKRNTVLVVKKVENFLKDDQVYK